MKSKQLLIMCTAGALLALAACDSSQDATPTPTLVIIPASPTVAPAAPVLVTSEGANLNQEKFTPGAPPLGAPELPVTQTPAPTQAAIPMQFVSSDGLSIAAVYYSAPVRPAPAVLLIHGRGSSKEAWQPFAARLQTAGYNVLAIDLRGHGETGGKLDWSKAQGDISSVLARLSALPGVDAPRISVVGESIGANLAAGACADLPNCKAAVLISPGLDFEGIRPGDALSRYGKRPLLIVVSKGDKPSGTDSITLDKMAQGEHILQLYDGAVHGGALFASQSGLADLIVNWLQAHRG